MEDLGPGFLENLMEDRGSGIVDWVSWKTGWRLEERGSRIGFPGKLDKG